MAFLKTLTVFLVCISIFEVVISKSATVGNKNNSKNYNVVLDGFLKCPTCVHYNPNVRVALDERLLVGHLYLSCNRNIYVRRNLTNPYVEDYKASFFFFCGSSYMNRSLENKNPKRVYNVSGVLVYEFGFVDLTATEERKDRKIRNRFRKYNS